MSWQRNSNHKACTPFRRASLNSVRQESSYEARSNLHNRSAPTIDVRTPVQQRLKRLQSSLKEEQLRKNVANKGGSPQVTPTAPPVSSRSSPRIQSTPTSSSLMSRLKIKRQSTPPRLPTPTPMIMSPPKKPLKRRSDYNHNDPMDLQTSSTTKKTRVDKSPIPASTGVRKYSAARRSSSSSSTGFSSRPLEPPQYENDIEMTDASIQEEICSLRDNPTARGDYSLSMTINAENKLVIKYKDHNQDEKTSSIHKRILDRQTNSDTLHIIVDTNIFIKDLSVFPKLMERQFPDKLGYPILVIPYIVLKELENLAHVSRGKPIEMSAKAANKYINDQFNAKNSQIKGQKIADHNNKLIDIESGDDDVLNCCLQVKESGKKVILLSNDVNLRNKALFNEIPAFSIQAIEKRDLKIEFTEL